MDPKIETVSADLYDLPTEDLAAALVDRLGRAEAMSRIHVVPKPPDFEAQELKYLACMHSLLGQQQRILKKNIVGAAEPLIKGIPQPRQRQLLRRLVNLYRGYRETGGPPVLLRATAEMQELDIDIVAGSLFRAPHYLATTLYKAGRVDWMGPYPTPD